ncbi:MAG: type IX secretion system membrane protein PorP/SprF, partial [Saprospiraceae bacterium]|nr:type IX secretion system membrane protein PorP/SprF [Saprospiraceae bacterium]
MSSARIILLILIFTFFQGLASQAQDARLNQFYAAPQFLNPAMTGVFDGSLRINANYREQWSSILGNNPFTTLHAGVDLRFHSVANDYFSFGLNSMLDKAGDGNFQHTKVRLGGSYIKQVGGEGFSNKGQFLVAGAQLGAGQYTVDFDGLWASDQFNSSIGYPDQGISSSDPALVGKNGDTDL